MYFTSQNKLGIGKNYRFPSNVCNNFVMLKRLFQLKIEDYFLILKWDLII